MGYVVMIFANEGQNIFQNENSLKFASNKIYLSALNISIFKIRIPLIENYLDTVPIMMIYSSH